MAQTRMQTKNIAIGVFYGPQDKNQACWGRKGQRWHTSTRKTKSDC